MSQFSQPKTSARTTANQCVPALDVVRLAMATCTASPDAEDEIDDGVRLRKVLGQLKLGGREREREKRWDGRGDSR
jgi:hypothetical protein